jgi:flagellar M-ring protein FliF
MVTVIDSQTGLVPHMDDGTSPSGQSDAREEALRASVTRLLEARVGVGRAIVEVSVEPITEREEITERRFEPDSRVPISSDSEETSTRSANAQGNGVTVASNLPEGDAAGSGGSSESSETRTREVVNYEVSETQRAVLREPGAIRRISVAVLVDGVLTTNEDGTSIWEPRSSEELDDMRELVASAIGFNETRGDQITMRSMEFQPLPEIEDPAPLSFLERASFDVLSLAQLAVLAIVSLVLGLFVVRPILTSAPAPQVAQIAPPTEDDASELPEVASLPAMDGEVSDIGPLDDFQPLDLPAFGGMDSEPDPADRLRQLIEEKQDETVEVLSQWMNDPQEEVTR